MTLGSLTVLDWLGIRHIKTADDEYSHTCPSCGCQMTTVPWYSECANQECELRVVSPLDFLAWSLKGDYAKAGALVNSRLKRPMVTKQFERTSKINRGLLLAWLRLCRAPMKLSAAMYSHNVLGEGGELFPGQESVCLLSATDLADLVNAAKISGADLSGDLRHDCSATRAAVVQSMPWCVDHILLHQPGKSATLSWARNRNGYGGLIGLASGPGRKFCSSPGESLKLQRYFRSTGSPEEMGFWYCAGGRSTVPFQIRKMLFVVNSAEDVITASKVIGDDSGLVRGIAKKHLMGWNSSASPVQWSSIRTGFFASSIRSTDVKMTPESVHLLESLAPPPEEIARLTQFFRLKNKPTIAAEIQAHLDNLVIAQDGIRTIRETASEYMLETPTSRASIANFALRIRTNVAFRDSSEMYFAGRIVCGREHADIIIRNSALDSPNALQSCLHQHYASRGAREAFTPTISDTSSFRKYVLPHLKKCVGSLGSVPGLLQLGWSADKQVYFAPGISIDMNGRQPGPSYFHPTQSALKLFEPAVEWPGVCTAEFPKPARDLIAMILAQVVRTRLNMLVRPICINQATAARSLALAISKSLGQRDVYEANANIRDNTHTPGVKGYPILVRGYTRLQANDLDAPIVLLTDSGYETSEDCFGLEETIGRTMQHSLLRVVEWLLATGGEDYKEVPSRDYAVSLLREGQWLAANVCQLQPWEITQEVDGIDEWLGQHDYDELCAGLRLTQDMRLIIPESLQCDGLLENLQSIDSSVEFADDIVGSAITLLPAFSRYFGRELLVGLAEEG